LGGSAYLQRLHSLKTGWPPRCNLEKEKDLHLALRALIHTGSIKSAHDCSEGGLAVALAECCISQQIARETPRLIGAQIDLQPKPSEDGNQPAAASTDTKQVRLDALLFGETQGRIVITTAALDATKVIQRARLLGISATYLGKVGGDKLTINTGGGEFVWPVSELYEGWWTSVARAMRS
jgi:AIR synthase related protein, C-terminal domain